MLKEGENVWLEVSDNESYLTLPVQRVHVLASQAQRIETSISGQGAVQEQRSLMYDTDIEKILMRQLQQRFE